MKTGLADRVAEILRSQPGRPFTARQLAVRLIAAHPAHYRAKLAASSFVSDEKALIAQVVAEIGARKISLQKNHPAVMLTADKPRRYVWTVPEARGRQPGRRRDMGDGTPEAIDPEILAGTSLVFEAVHVLHRRGLQLVRVCPGLTASGCHYRIYVLTADNLEPDNLMVARWDRGTLWHTTGFGPAPFGWRDLAGAAPERVADRMLQEEPGLLRAGRGRDWPYAGWYAEILGLIARGGLPSFFQMGEWHGGLGNVGKGGVPPRPPSPPGASPPGDTGPERPSEAPVRDADSPSSPAAPPGFDAETVDLALFDLSDDRQRRDALLCFYHQWEEALLPFTAIVWDRLASPKAARAEAMSARLGLGGKGKVALNRVLKAFLEQADAALQVRAMPEPGPEGITDTYHQAVQFHFIWMDEVLASYAARWARILNGDSADPSPAHGVVIQGPWRQPWRTART